MKITITSDVNRVRRRLNTIQRKQLPTITYRAMNKAAKAGTTYARRTVAKAVGVPQTVIKPMIDIRLAGKSRLLAHIATRRQAKGITGFNVVRYLSKAKQVVGAFRKKPGVSYKVRGQQPRLVPGSFTAPIAGRVQVMKRKGIDRQPIKSVKGPSPMFEFSDVFKSPVLRATVQRAWRREFLRLAKRL